MDKHVLTGDEVADRAELWPIERREELADSVIFQLWRDTVTTPAGETIVRGYLHHPGAVGVIALDDEDRVAVVRQYRHPLALRMLEAPAGLLDVDGEPPFDAAQRELAEEAMLTADDWRILVDHSCSGGSTQETIRIFLARGLHPTPRPEGFVLEGEELQMDLCWVPLDELVAAQLAGRCQNGVLNVGVMALVAARATGRLDDLRTPDAPWPARAQKAALDGVQPR